MRLSNRGSLIPRKREREWVKFAVKGREMVELQRIDCWDNGNRLADGQKGHRKQSVLSLHEAKNASLCCAPAIQQTYRGHIRCGQSWLVSTNTYESLAQHFTVWVIKLHQYVIVYYSQSSLLGLLN